MGVKLLDPEDTSTMVLFETSRNYLHKVTESHPGDVCCHVFYCYRQTHCLSYVRCDTRGEGRVDQMRKVSEFVVGNVFAGFEWSWSQQSYTVQKSHNIFELQGSGFWPQWSPVFVSLFWYFVTGGVMSGWGHVAGKWSSPPSCCSVYHLEPSQALPFVKWDWLYLMCQYCFILLLNLTCMFFRLFEVILYFCYWYFIRSWNQIHMLHWKWIPTFMRVLFVSMNRDHELALVIISM